jgi:DIM1 family U5 snRNP protein
MSFLLAHLHTGWDVDQAIVWEKERLVIMRFGHDTDTTCMAVDEILSSCAELVKKFAVIYVVDITEVPFFNEMYELKDACSVMFFFRNRIVQIDYGTGENNKMTFAVPTKQEFIDICEVAYRGVCRGVWCVESPINYARRGAQKKKKAKVKPI